MALNKRIAFIGGGNMAEALIKGILSADVATADLLTVTDVSPSRIATLKARYRIAAAAKNIDAVREAEIVLLCVKPQQIEGVLAEIAPAIDGRKLVISIAAGVQIERIARGLSGKPRVVRVMPNAPALVLAGATAIAAGAGATHADVELAQEIFGAIGK